MLEEDELRPSVDEVVEGEEDGLVDRAATGEEGDKGRGKKEPKDRGEEGGEDSGCLR